LNFQKSTVDCRPCDPGSYCEGAAQLTVTGDCTEGYYCTVGSPTPTPGDAPTPAGYQTIYPAVDSSTYGGECTRGAYCPAASPIEAPCPAGHYCPDAGMTETDMLASLCPAGKYCNQGQTGGNFEQPINCPAGHFCPEGSSAGVPCPIGTFRPNEGGSSADQCASCTAG
jgi:hypothetical protein